jgi:hypothetical protein
MTTNNVRAFVAIAMVVVFLGLTVVMALFPLFSTRNVAMSDYAEFFVKIVSVYTGILGVIVGYYFARVEGSKQAQDATKDLAPSQSEKPGAA